MYFYLHIPKTGGQTLAMRLASGFAPGRAYVMAETLSDAAQLEALTAAYDFAEAHVDTAALKDAPAALQVICTVRDPVAQVISHYRHLRREPGLGPHRAAKQLPPAEFFEKFGDLMLNFQTRYLVSVFNTKRFELGFAADTRWLMDRLGAVVDRVRWLVPTERIDEFCQLWSIEQGIHLPLAELSRNRTGADEVDQSGLRAILTDHLDRMGLDFTLWNLARDSFALWRRKVLAAPRPGAPPLRNIMCAWHAGESEIRLGQGWHPRVERSDGIAEWWAGPTQSSEILVTNAAGERYMLFEVAVLLGVRPGEIVLHDGASGTPLEQSRTRIEGSETILYRVTLPEGPGPHRILAHVPRVKSAIEMIPDATDATRRSFASQNWRLVRA